MNWELLDEMAGENKAAEYVEIPDEGCGVYQEEILESESLEQIGEGVFLEHMKGLFHRMKGLIEGREECETIIGNPEKDMESWHMQDSDVSCAVCCQEFIAEQVTGREFTEQEFCDLAEKQGWFDPETGTALKDVGRILEYMGFDVTHDEGVTVQELAQMLENGEKIIVGVNNMVLMNPELANVPGMSANHAVQVIGMDVADPNNIQVILNDPGIPNGRGIRHSLDEFEAAWNTGNRFTISATKE